MMKTTKTNPLWLYLLLAVALAGCAADLGRKQDQLDGGLSAFSKGFSAAVQSKTLTDKRAIAACVQLIREWKQASLDLELARTTGDFSNEKFWNARIFGDGTMQNPGIIGRAAVLALNWKKL